MGTVYIKAYGKINLGLDVIRKREDGYHDLDMVMQMVSLADVLIFTDREDKDIVITCDKPEIPTDERNLIYKAAKLMMETYDLDHGINVKLTKNIPMAAGMAGGSSDCAVTMVAMNRLFNLGLSVKDMCTLGEKLGADVPYCVLCGTARAQGKGEILKKLPEMPPTYVLLAKPNIEVSTGFVYGNLKIDDTVVHPNITGMVDAIKAGDYKGVYEKLGNVLEIVTIPAYPVIADMKKSMVELGADNSLMSGSGPTVFGLFQDEDKANVACEKMKEIYPDAFVFLSKTVNL